MKGRRAHIIGLGRSGIAAAKLLMSREWSVIASDMADKDKLDDAIQELTDAGAKVFTGGHDEALEIEVDLAVVSPGVPLNSKVVSQLQRRDVQVVSELEIGWRYCRGKVVAVTGTNGKTTTTALLGDIFLESPYLSFSCGNIGIPLSAVADMTNDETLLAVEVSSFQLLTMESFRPDVAVFLNLTPDHLDWHSSFEEYAEAKSRLWVNQTEDDWLVHNADDPEIEKLILSASSRKFPFSLIREFRTGAFYKNKELVVRLPDHSEFRLPRSDLKLLGLHNVENALAALSAALLLDVDSKVIQAGVAGFEAIPHRLEIVRELDGVVWINDSMATNIEAGLAALEAMESPTVMIAGGKAKGSDFRRLRAEKLQRVKRMILIGEAADLIERDVDGVVDVVHAIDMADAVEKARQSASAGDVVLLSPLCASFDMFRNFEERGDAFKRLVMKLS